MYFSNNVIKVRYDLIEQSHNYALTENDVFDFYYDIFKMKEGQSVKNGTPLLSLRNHRLAFIFSDRQNFTPSVIMHVPYLHEKKLYLNR